MSIQVTEGSEDGQAPTGALPAALPVLPLRGTVVFPLTVVPLAAAQARSLLLIDDVMTTGATAEEAARTLCRAGAIRVTVAVLARVTNDEPGIRKI